MQRNSSVLLILLFPLLLTISIGCYMLYRNSHAIGNPAATFGYNPWKYVLARHIFQFYSLLYPILASILCFSVCDVEFKNSGYKHLFLLPVNRNRIFACKLMFIIRTLILSITIAFLTFMATGYLLGALLPGYRFGDYQISAITLTFFIRLFLSLLAITMIQTALSLASRNFVIPTAFACLASFCALVMQRWEYIEYVPYHSGWNAFNGFAADHTSWITRVEYINAAYLCICLLICFFVFNKSRA